MIEYSVPSSRPVSVYDVLLVEIPLLESLKQSVLLVLVKEIVYLPSATVQETLIEVVDEKTSDRLNPAGV